MGINNTAYPSLVHYIEEYRSRRYRIPLYNLSVVRRVESHGHVPGPIVDTDFKPSLHFLFRNIWAVDDCAFRDIVNAFLEG